MTDTPKPFIPRMSHLAFPLGVLLAFIIRAVVEGFIESDFDLIPIVQIIVAFGLLASSLLGLVYSVTAYYLERWPTAKFSIAAGVVVALAFLIGIAIKPNDILMLNWIWIASLMALALSAVAVLFVKRHMPASSES